jgi:hypothetical protein
MATPDEVVESRQHMIEKHPDLSWDAFGFWIVSFIGITALFSQFHLGPSDKSLPLIDLGGDLIITAFLTQNRLVAYDFFSRLP